MGLHIRLSRFHIGTCCFDIIQHYPLTTTQIFFFKFAFVEEGPLLYGRARVWPAEGLRFDPQYLQLVPQAEVEMKDRSLPRPWTAAVDNPNLGCQEI